MTAFASYVPADFQFDVYQNAPSSPDDASTDSIGSPNTDFPDTFMTDLPMTPGAGLDVASLDQLDYSVYACLPPEPTYYAQQPNCDFQGPAPEYYSSPVVKVESTLSPALQQSVAASVEALKASDACKGYPSIPKQHATIRKMKANSSRPPVEEERVVRRRTKNREAAQASRLRKRVRLETLEGLVAEQKAITAAIMAERDNMQRENATLRSEVEFLKEALRSSMEGLQCPEAADQLFPQPAELAL